MCAPSKCLALRHFTGNGCKVDHKGIEHPWLPPHPRQGVLTPSCWKWGPVEPRKPGASLPSPIHCFLPGSCLIKTQAGCETASCKPSGAGELFTQFPPQSGADGPCLERGSEPGWPWRGGGMLAALDAPRPAACGAVLAATVTCAGGSLKRAWTQNSDRF